MDLSKLSASEKRILYAAAGVVVGGLVGIADRWGIFSILGGLAGAAAAFVILQPQVAPTVKLPMPKATLLVACGAVAAGGFALAILTYLGYALDITRPLSILFDLGFVAALALGWFTWLDYKATMPAAAAPATSAAPASTEPPAPPSA